MKHRILITGSNGLLGQALVANLLARKIDFLATSLGENRNPDCANDSYESLNITDERAVDVLIDRYQPTAIIHTAAMTNVDLCEKEVENCRILNIQSTEYLFDAARLNSIHFQLLSTDFVFDGEKGNYKETDEVGPLSVYAKSKVEAENLLIFSDYTNWSIVRTIIVYGRGHNLSRGNIILWAKEQLEAGKQIKIVNDQFRSPTFAPDLAEGCVLIIENDETGIFHLSGPECFSIFEIVTKIAQFWKLDQNLIEPAETNSLAQTAGRPPKTGFNLSKARSKLGYDPKTLEESFEEL
jgi:dTDP-4-dehydrorhamnose reductase